MTGMNTASEQEVPSVRLLLHLSVPAIIVGVICAAGLFLVDEAAHFVEEFLWMFLPGLLHVSPDSGWWIFAVLGLTGFVIGLVITFVKGHGGGDSATVELIAPPMQLSAVPGLVVVTALGLGGGVSLGPESAIIAINTAILVALVNRFWPRMGAELVVMLSVAGTIGALFGTPVAAILVLTGVVAAAKTGACCGTGSSCRFLVRKHGLGDHAGLGRAAATRTGAAARGSPVAGAVARSGPGGVPRRTRRAPGRRAFPAAAWIVPPTERPLLYTTLGGLVLGLLGALLGGPLTLFKGSTQMVELVGRAGEFTGWQLAYIAAVKLAALLVAGTAGFRGGRIFPAVFIGVAVGLMARRSSRRSRWGWRLPAAPWGPCWRCPATVGSLCSLRWWLPGTSRFCRCSVLWCCRFGCWLRGPRK